MPLRRNVALRDCLIVMAPGLWSEVHVVWSLVMSWNRRERWKLAVEQSALGGRRLGAGAVASKSDAPSVILLGHGRWTPMTDMAEGMARVGVRRKVGGLR